MESTSRAPLVTHDFLLLVSGHFLQAIALPAIVLLPLYLAYLGASRTEIGSIMAMAALGSVLARPIVAWSVDSLGSKKTIAAGTILSALAMAALGMVVDRGPFVYAIRFVMGAGGGAIWTAYFTFAADHIPIERRTEGIALFGVSGLLPLAIDPFVGELGIRAPDLGKLFLVVAVLIAISFVPVLFVQEVRAKDDRARFSVRAAIDALRRPSLWPAWLAIIVFGSLVSMFFAFATVTAERRGVGQPAAMWLTYALGAAFVRLGGGGLPDRIGPAKLVPPAFACYAIAVASSAVASSTTAFAIAGFLAGMGHGFAFPVLTSQVVSRTPQHLRGSAIATLTALWELAGMILSPAFGAVADLWGDRVMFFAAAAFAIAGCLVWWPLERRCAGTLPHVSVGSS